MREPSLMWAPWVTHYFPGIKKRDMEDIRLSEYVAMWDMVKDTGS